MLGQELNQSSSEVYWPLKENETHRERQKAHLVAKVGANIYLSSVFDNNFTETILQGPVKHRDKWI